MRKLFACLSIWSTAIVSISFGQFQEKDVNRYIETYKDIAIAEQVKNKVPASIKLAQGIYETAAGTSELANNAYNHFGIKCKSSWQGQTYTYDDDRKNECFRKYNSHEASYLDHSQFLISNKRYSPLFELSVLDYKGWARQLKKSGYATNPVYAEKIIDIVERYNLNQYTEIALYNTTQSPALIAAASEKEVFVSFPAPSVNTSARSEKPEEKSHDYYRILNLHGLKGFYAQKGDMLLEHAIKYKIRYTTLLNYNDLRDEPLPYDMFIYIESKKKTGDRPHVVVGRNQTLHYISQAEGVQLEQLRSLNKLAYGEEPAEGISLNLQSPLASKPTLRSVSANTSYTQNDVKVERNIRDNPIITSKDDGVVKIVDESVIDQAQSLDEDEQEEELAEASDPNDEIVEDEVEEVLVQTSTPGNFRVQDVADNKESNSKGASGSNATVPKGSNVSQNQDGSLDQLKKRMDRSVYSDEDAIPVKKSAYNEGLAKIEAESTNYDNRVPPPNSELNRIPKKNIENSARKSSIKDPNIAFKEHMKRVKSGLAPAYYPKATGVAHTAFITPAAPKKAPAKNTKVAVKNTKQTKNAKVAVKNAKNTKTTAANKKAAANKKTVAKPANTKKQTAQKTTKSPVKKKK